MSTDPRVTSLGSVTTWLSGGTPNRANVAYWSGSVPWISAATLKTTRVHDSDQHITETAVRAGSKLAPEGATLVLVRGMALRHEVRASLVTRPVSFNQDVKALVPKPTILSAYLTYSILARRTEILDLVSSAGSGTGVLDTALLKQLPIWLPELEEQQKVINAIDDAEASCDSLERAIAKKQAMKRGMMQQLLTGRTRLPGFSGTWGREHVGSVLGTLQAGVSVNSVSAPGTQGVLKTSCISGGTFDPSERKTIAPSDVAKARVNPRADSLIISRMNTPALVGEVGYVDTDQPTLFLPDRLWLATGKKSEQVDMRWLGCLLSSGHYRERMREIATGTSGSMKNISRPALLGLQIPLPEIEEQRAISALFAEVDHEIDALRLRLAKARDVKQGMMQQLLTGRTRLAVQE